MSSLSVSRTSSVDGTGRSSSSGSQSFDLQSALSSAMFRRKSRMQYDTMRTLTSPLSSSLSSSPTHQPSRRLTSINDAFEGDEGDTVQLDAAPVPAAPPMSGDDIPLPPPPPPPPGPPPTFTAAAVKPACFVPPRPAASPSVDPRDELLAAIRGGARLQSASARPISPVVRPPAELAGRHERSGSSLSEVVAVASSIYHSRLGSVSVSGKPAGVELRKPSVAPRPIGGGAGGRDSGSVSSSGANSELAALLQKRKQKIAEGEKK